MDSKCNICDEDFEEKELRVPLELITPFNLKRNLLSLPIEGTILMEKQTFKMLVFFEFLSFRFIFQMYISYMEEFIQGVSINIGHQLKELYNA